MRGILVAILAFSGCAVEHGEIDDVTGDDPGGSGSGAPRADFDGDGFDDLVDNCAIVANADQRDHDDDGRGDSCDVCPHLKDTGKDADGDAVGDACDPRPTLAGDRIAFFEGFYGNIFWKPVIGANSWELVDGALRQSKLDAIYQLVRDDNPNLTTVFVDARVRVNAMATTSARRSVGLVLGYGDPDHFFYCGLVSTGPATEVNAGEVSTDFWGSARYEYTPGTFPAPMSGDWLTLQARSSIDDRGETVIDCMSHRTGATGSARFVTGTEAPGDVGVRTNGADTSFDYVFVVETPAS